MSAIGAFLAKGVVVFSLVWSGLVAAAEFDEKALADKLQKAIPQLKITRISPSAIPGVAEAVAENEQRLYVTYDGKHFVAGDLYQVSGDRIENMTEAARSSDRAEWIKSIPDSQVFVFGPENAKATVNVFTDIDCGYCRKLHAEIAEMNELGIRVRYLAFPRAGVGSDSYDKMVSAWCADDRNKALTDAKMGKSISKKDCKNPVAEQMRLGERMGVSGTPAMVLENGQMLPGYVPARKLAEGLGLL